MERYAFKLLIRDGMIEEYKRRHDAIWPEMTAMLNEAGIHNYTIWNVGNELFGYYECDSVDHAARVQRESPIVEKWGEYMADVMVDLPPDPETGAQPRLRQVFYHP